MADKTAYLGLTLPLNGEYPDNWNEPINANFETIDDDASNTNEQLAGTGNTLTVLKGTKTSLYDRLQQRINDDGTLKLEDESNYTVLASSKKYAKSSASDPIVQIMDRFSKSELELADLHVDSALDRYGSAAVDRSALSGIARLSARYPQGTDPTRYWFFRDITDRFPDPRRGFTANSVVDGASDTAPGWLTPNHLTWDSGAVRLQIGSVYNIDGFLFKSPGALQCTAMTGPSTFLAAGTYLVGVSRNSADYNYSGSLKTYFTYYSTTNMGGAYAIDTRVVPTCATLRADAPGADSSTGGIVAGGNTLTDVSASFSAYGVEAGDLLVIHSTDDYVNGTYVVSSVTDDTHLNVTATFLVTNNTVSYHILKPYVPAITFTNKATVTNYPRGVVYVGEAICNGTAFTGTTAYAFNGVWDSGWMPMASVWSVSFQHYLGTHPGAVDIWIKNTSTGYSYKNPNLIIAGQHLDKNGGSSWAQHQFPVPGFRVQCTDSIVFLYLYNPIGITGGPPYAPAFTDKDGNDIAFNDTNHVVKIIASR